MKIYDLWTLVFIVALNYSDGHRTIRLQDYLCADKFLLALQKPFRGNPRFTLMEDRESAAFVWQTWNTTLPGFYSSNKLKYDCRFSVHTMPRPVRGIYIIITHLKFRKDPIPGNCLDYIEFYDGNRSPSGRKCGEISIDGIGERYFFDERHREVNVHIHIDKKAAIYEPLILHMMLTAHSECRFSEDFLCDPSDENSCISKSLVNDNFTNCPPPCPDENSCYHDVITSEQINTANVAISAITSLIFTMLGVGFFVWICWKYWNCITLQQAQEGAAVATTRRGPLEAPVIELPTAPSYNDIPQQQQQQTPKDFPPSYESLFPDR